MNLLKIIQRLTFRESRKESDFIPNPDDIVNMTDVDKALAIVLRTLNGTDLSWLTELETHIFQDVILDVVECMTSVPEHNYMSALVETSISERLLKQTFKGDYNE